MAFFGFKKKSEKDEPSKEKAAVEATKKAPKTAKPKPSVEKKSEKSVEKKSPKPVAMKATSSKAKTLKGSPAGSANELLLLRPRITEKATEQSERGVYVFDVDPRSTKPEIKKVIKELYGVNPRKVNLIKIQSRQVMGRRGHRGRKPGGKKAMVYLREGDTIDSV